MNKVSIIVPCYKQAKYLDEALQSVLDQTYTNWECIIVNDGSPDNTEEVAQEWTAKDPRFKYIEKENGGLSSARNAGIAMAMGEFILPLDADDKIGTDYVDLAIDSFEKDDALKVVYCKVDKFGDCIGEWKLPGFSLEKLARNNMIFCSAIFRKKEWEIVQGYDENMKYGWEDWEFWISILKNGGDVKQLNYIGFYYRIKENSMIKELKHQEKESLLKYMSFKHTDFYIAQLGSFKKMNDDLESCKEQFERKLNSEKFVIDLFLKTFFKFTIFGKYKKQ